MRVSLACIPCIMKQAYNTAIRATDDEEAIRRILNLTAEYITTLDLSQSPADASNFVYHITSKIAENPDPYLEDKKKYNDLCLSMLPDLRKRIDESEDPLYTAVKISVLGNFIDLGIGHAFDLARDLERILDIPFAIDDYSDFVRLLASGRKNILYLGDNAGEIVFDRLLIEQLIPHHDITFVVKKSPIINDATREDAEYVGMTDIVPVIDTGSNDIGVGWSKVSEEFVRRYKSADLIIAKGHGNYETMEGKRGIIFFILKAKCAYVAKTLGVSLGDCVFRMSRIGE